MNMDIINRSAEPLNKLYSWLPLDLKADKVVFFPDACPGKSPLPTGCAVLTRQPNWRKFAISDCGCGMRLLESKVPSSEFSREKWDQVYWNLKENKGKLGDLGSGNHFIDALERYDSSNLFFLIHTGSRNESKLVEDLVDKPVLFDRKFSDVCDWAEANRKTIGEILENYFGPLELLIDKNHNHYEILDNDQVIIRKGAVALQENELTVLPSNMNGDIVLVRANSNIDSVLHSMGHGTGRVMSRGEAKKYADSFDYDQLRNEIYIPSMISNNSIRTEAPFCYRLLDECLELIDDLVVEEGRFSPIAYLGQI